ncbi:MAG: ATP-dependent zinc metalloprotease FtsH [Chlamydiales bacterium]
MSTDKNVNFNKKKKFSGGILFLFSAILLAVLVLQNFTTDKHPPIAFSHQLEHVVNLDLIETESNKKISLTDNLVSFSGKFKDSLSQEAENRYAYLELLNEYHGLQDKKDALAQKLPSLQEDVFKAAQWYVTLAGVPIPEDGYGIVTPDYKTVDRKRAITIQESLVKDFTSLPELQKKITLLERQPVISLQDLKSIESDLSTLIQNFGTPILGIGEEDLKAQLRTISGEVEKVIAASDVSHTGKFLVYKRNAQQLQNIALQLDQKPGSVRLLPLRSVRSYIHTLNNYRDINQQLDVIKSKLNRAKDGVGDIIWFFNNKELSTRMLEREGSEEFRQWFKDANKEWKSFVLHQGMSFKAPDQPRNAVLEKTFPSAEPLPNYLNYLFSVLPILLILALLYFIFSRQLRGMGNTAMSFGKSPARMLNRAQNKITFKDVAGIEEAKEELQEVVEFLKSPAKFTALGARIPKGVLCIGPPGTGKTLIAKAVAGEANCPFFSISGSDFVEMFVGVGASRIRDLFREAKEKAPCIIFIDEIDAVGRHRGAGVGGGHDEREQTLNQLLVEMDGFDTNEGVILMAATNRPDVLDRALLRPGRFDRRIVLDLPDIRGRFEILQVHAARVKLDSSVDLMFLARSTPGASGADLMSVLNEAALLAARRTRSAVTMQDITDASDKVRYGKERRSLELDKQEKTTTAYHEAGHAILGLLVEHSDPVEKVTIVPRGLSLGATYFVPKRNHVGYRKKEVLDRLTVLMGGRAAEELFIGDISSGARGDFSQATRLVRQMVCEWGMSDELGTVAYDENADLSAFSPGHQEVSYSETTLHKIDGEVKGILTTAYDRAKSMLQPLEDKVHHMAELLVEFETLDKEDIDHILAGNFDVKKKRQKIETTEKLMKKVAPTPPPIPETPNNGGSDPTPVISS